MGLKTRDFSNLFVESFIWIHKTCFYFRNRWGKLICTTDRWVGSDRFTDVRVNYKGLHKRTVKPHSRFNFSIWVFILYLSQILAAFISTRTCTLQRLCFLNNILSSSNTRCYLALLFYLLFCEIHARRKYTDKQKTEKWV